MSNLAHQSEVVKAVSARVNFSSEVGVDGYQMPDGSYRMSMASASLAVGFAQQWLGRALAKGGTTKEALLREGFEGKIVKVASREMGANLRPASTISIDDFIELVSYAADQGKKEARGLMKAFLKVTVYDFFQMEFEGRAMSLEEKRSLISKEYAKSLNWFQEDLDDLKALIEFNQFHGG